MGGKSMDNRPTVGNEFYAVTRVRRGLVPRLVRLAGCALSVARAALDVEDRAAMATAAYEPFALARIAKAERAAADRSGSHAAAADGTYHWLLANEGVLYLGELNRSVLGGLGHAFILHKCGVDRWQVATQRHDLDIGPLPSITSHAYGQRDCEPNIRRRPRR
jgi:hypothetical protein